MADDNEAFETGEAGASQTELVESQKLKIGSPVMVKGFPCKVTEVSTAKPGKHGSAKVILKGRDILTAKVYEATFHSGDMIPAPIIIRDEFVLLNLDDDNIEVLDKQGEVKSDLNMPEAEHLKDVANRIKSIFDEGKKECLITVITTLGKEQVIEVREGNDA